ncbi:hypothetical protein B932_2779 [Gluconobacter oxydans H24]|nr:hypothetical protein B932_2779 [Gluconobacter oxydans H24]
MSSVDLLFIPGQETSRDNGSNFCEGIGIQGAVVRIPGGRLRLGMLEGKGLRSRWVQSPHCIQLADA